MGCLLDLDTMQMRFYLNGNDLGVAFTNFHTGTSNKSFRGESGMYPGKNNGLSRPHTIVLTFSFFLFFLFSFCTAVSLNMGQAARFNFGPPFGKFHFSIDCMVKHI